MSQPVYATTEVHRAIAREDLLTMAVDADEAVSIVGNQPSLARRTKDDRSLFVIALDRYLELGREGDQWPARAWAWDNAATIVRFGAMVGLRPECELSPEQMHERALAENASDDESTLDKDLPVGVFSRYHAGRNLRLVGRHEEALSLVMRPREELFGRGAEPYIAHYLFEQGAVLLAQGQGDQAVAVLREYDGYWEGERPHGFPTRYRFDFIRALACWDSEEANAGEALTHLDSALNRIREGVPVPELTFAGDLRESVDDHGVRELSVALTQAEFLATTATEEARAKAVTLGCWALHVANQVRGRMRVIARSRAPLAAAFRRLYGDIALLADRLCRMGTPGAAELGLQASLAAKQTGFAARIRAGRDLMNDYVKGKLDELLELEGLLGEESYGTTVEDRETRIDRVVLQLGDNVSAMLAATVLPKPVELEKLAGILGPRYALDYLELPHSTDERPALFRSLVRPGLPVHFERFDAPDGVAAFFTRRRQDRDLVDGLGRDMRPHRPAAERPSWRTMAGLLPELLRAELAAAHAEPIPLVISGHSWLSLVPWAALAIGDGDSRLVQRALITQTPVLTCVTTEGPPPVRGPVLVRLVGPRGTGDPGVHVVQERAAWGLPAINEDVPLGAGSVPSRPVPEPLESPLLAKALTKDAGWAFLHVASHGGPGTGKEDADGDHDGLRQVLQLPEQPLTAALALGLHWPTSVLMASCHVGQVVNARDAEPLNFVMALLTGGARCVVAGIAAIGDKETGRVAHDMVKRIRKGDRPLDEALRAAQLAAIERGAHEAGWALLAAYVR